MSKTFRKYPSAKDYSRDKTPFMKRLSNKKIRKEMSIASGRSFKKVFNSYDITDYKFVYYGDSYVDYEGSVITDFGYKYKSRKKALCDGKIFDRKSIRKENLE